MKLEILNKISNFIDFILIHIYLKKKATLALPPKSDTLVVQFENINHPYREQLCSPKFSINPPVVKFEIDLPVAPKQKFTFTDIYVDSVSKYCPNYDYKVLENKRSSKIITFFTCPKCGGNVEYMVDKKDLWICNKCKMVDYMSGFSKLTSNTLQFHNVLHFYNMEKETDK